MNNMGAMYLSVSNEKKNKTKHNEYTVAPNEFNFGYYIPSKEGRTRRLDQLFVRRLLSK